MNISKRSTGLVLFVLAPLAGCATVTPPPSMMALGGASHGPVGATAVTAFGGVMGGVFIQPSLGGGARVAHRLSDTVAIGVDGVAGAVTDPSTVQAAPRTLYAGRLHAQVNPGGTERTALTFGLGGGGSNNALSYGTIDVGFRSSWRPGSGVFEPYVGAAVALSVPFAVPAGAEVTADGDDRRFLTTAYVVANGGLAVHATERFDVLFDVPIFLGYSASNNAFIVAPTVGLRYAFGGEVRRAR